MNKFIGATAALFVAALSTSALAQDGYFAEPQWQQLENTTAQDGITVPMYERAKSYRNQFHLRVDDWDTNVGPNSPRPLFLAEEDRPGPAFVVKPPTKPVAIVAPDDATVNFAWDSATLTVDAQSTLDAFVADANEAGVTEVTVGGYTDTSGPASYNDDLGMRRALNVVAYLENSGLDAKVAGITSYGETNLAVETGDGVRNYENRRAVVSVQ